MVSNRAVTELPRPAPGAPAPRIAETAGPARLRFAPERLEIVEKRGPGVEG